MREESVAKLRALLNTYAERKAKELHEAKPSHAEAERQRRACGDVLRTVARPVLEEFQSALREAGHEAATRDHTDRNDAYPSVALSFTPRTPNSPDALASAIIFRYDPRHGLVVQSDVKPSPRRGKVVTTSSDRLGTIRVDAVSAPWVGTKMLGFIEAVLKAN